MKKLSTAVRSASGRAVPSAIKSLLIVFLFVLSAMVALGAPKRAAVIAQSAPAAGRSKAARSKPVSRTTALRRKTSTVRRAAPKEVPGVDPTIGDDSSGEDLPVRQAAIEALRNEMGSMVVVDPASGRILTIVNQKLVLRSGYQPCSTFKPAVALAALQEGVIENDNTRLRLGKKWYMDLHQGLAFSNNVYFAKLGTLLGLERLEKYARVFGFGEPAGWGMEDPAGSFPSQPPPASHGGVGKVASFGEGIEQTPLQLVSFVSAVANGGTLYYLQYPKTREEMENFTPRVKRTLDIRPWLEPVRQGMLEAVLFGTARRARQPDLTILGKTGSCSEDGMKLGWFAGYSQQEKGLAVAVLLRTVQPMGGGPHAAEIAGRLYRKLADEKYVPQSAERMAPAGAPLSSIPTALLPLPVPASVPGAAPAITLIMQ